MLQNVATEEYEGDSMKTPLHLLIIWLILPAMIVPAAQVIAPLDQTREVIVGTGEMSAAVPINAVATTSTLPVGRRNLLTEIPGKPFRQVDPPPETVTYWKIPFYAAIGLPRDLIDAFMGGMAFVPIISNIDYVVYELVPTQIVMRDPSDWHRWDGEPNRKGHAFYKGDWGWFPTAHAWKLKHPNARKAKKNEEYNAKLQKQLDELNSEAEAANQSAAQAQRDARQAAFEALQAGKTTDPTGATAGRIATGRMLPIYQTAQLDEGAFALLMASLAAYQDSPKWEQDLLWSELMNASPTRLQPARRLLQEMAATYPANTQIPRALILTDMLLGQPADALNAANNYADGEAGQPTRNRLVFETAIAAGRANEAKAAFEAMRAANQFPDQLALMQDRLNIATGQLEAARKSLAARLAQNPADPYLNYYLGVADLQIAQQGGQGYEAAIKAAQTELQMAAETGSPILRADAKKALSLANQIGSDLARRPSLSDNPPNAQPAAEKPAKEKKQSPRNPLQLKLK